MFKLQEFHKFSKDIIVNTVCKEQNNMKHTSLTKKSYKYSHPVCPLTWQKSTLHWNCCQLLLNTLIFTARVILETESCTSFTSSCK